MAFLVYDLPFRKLGGKMWDNQELARALDVLTDFCCDEDPCWTEAEERAAATVVERTATLHNKGYSASLTYGGNSRGEDNAVEGYAPGIGNVSIEDGKDEPKTIALLKEEDPLRIGDWVVRAIGGSQADWQHYWHDNKAPDTLRRRTYRLLIKNGEAERLVYIEERSREIKFLNRILRVRLYPATTVWQKKTPPTWWEKLWSALRSAFWST